MLNCKYILKILAITAALSCYNNFSFAQNNNPNKPIDPEAAKESATENLVNKIGSGISAIIATNKASSLMLDSDEHNNLDRAVESLKNNQTFVPDGQQDNTSNSKKDEEGKKNEEQQQQESQKAYIYLGSILYYSPQNWVVWINNQKITPKDNSADKELYLKLVQEDKAKLVWTLSMTKWKIISGQKSESLAPKINDKNQVEVEFELRSNQTFNLSNNKVSEGRMGNAIKPVQKEKTTKKKQLSDNASSDK